MLNERTSFQSLISKIPSDGGITLQFQQVSYDVVNPDSVVILANYELVTNHQLQTIPKMQKDVYDLYVLKNVVEYGAYNLGWIIHCP